MNRERIAEHGHVGAEGEVRLINITRADQPEHGFDRGQIVGARDARCDLADPRRRRIGEQVRHLVGVDPPDLVKQPEPAERRIAGFGIDRPPPRRRERLADLIRQIARRMEPARLRRFKRR